ncbi:MAG: ATP-grasp domain-containing protein [Planctomycetota bacterium]
MEYGSHSRVVLIFGGFWEERDVSIASANRILSALRAGSLLVTPVRWDLEGWTVLNDECQDLNEAGAPRPPLVVLNELREEGLGVVFNALHGGFGEDGTLQGFLTLAGVPFTGAGVHASAITLNKESFRQHVRNIGYEVPVGGVVRRDEWEENPNDVLTAISVDIGLPVVIKPVSSGSSCGVILAADIEKVSATLDEHFEQERAVLVERYIGGREISVACLGTRYGLPPDVLPIIEIEPLTKSGLFDYEAKYDPKKVRETVPAPLEADLVEHLESMVSHIHQDLELGGVSRTDIILGADGPVILETQTVPGMTADSLLPKCAESAGIEFNALCRRLIDYALSAYLAKGAESLYAAEE